MFICQDKQLDVSCLTIGEGIFANYTYSEYRYDEDKRSSAKLTYMELEGRIGRGLLTPPHANSQTLLKDLDEYLARLRKILKAFEQNEPGQNLFANKQMMIIGKYGPKVHQLSWDKKHMMDIYKWNETQLLNMTLRLKAIENLWNSVNHFMRWWCEGKLGEIDESVCK